MSQRSPVMALWRLLQRLDDAEFPLLKHIPPATKRTWLRWFFAALPSQYKHEFMQVGQLRLRIPGSPTRRLQMTADGAIAEFMRQRLAPGMQVVDVGANIGWYALLAASLVGPAGKVYAVEPTPDTLDVLRENVRMNGLQNVVVLPVAAGAKDEEREFFINGRYGGTNSMFDTKNVSQPSRSIRIKAARLDNLIEGPLDMAKIDVEGAELEALAGMERLLATSPSLCLVVEWNPRTQQAAGYPPERLPEALLEKGFRLSILGHNETPLRNAQEIQAALSMIAKRSPHFVDLMATRN
ncbi:MAG TPA: FkbM family methyltransferase [Caldilineaceae bacterium]|nr:FkbM family methyltransferase [Caldilineaceae bacterium]